MFEPTTFPGCQAGGTGVCTDICAAVDARRTADAAAVEGATLSPLSGCNFFCRCLIEVDGRCTRASVRDVESDDVVLDGDFSGNVHPDGRFTSCSGL